MRVFWGLVLGLWLAGGLFASGQEVTGTVRDTKGNPLPGVTVRVRGGGVSAFTDEKGMFRIQIDEAETDPFLEFRKKGFMGKDIAVRGRKKIDPVLGTGLVIPFNDEGWTYIVDKDTVKTAVIDSNRIRAIEVLRDNGQVVISIELQ